MKECGMKECGMKECGVKECGVKERGVKERGARMPREGTEATAGPSAFRTPHSAFRNFVTGSTSF
jgi:hypothetical protein